MPAKRSLGEDSESRVRSEDPCPGSGSDLAWRQLEKDVLELAWGTRLPKSMLQIVSVQTLALELREGRVGGGWEC